MLVVLHSSDLGLESSLTDKRSSRYVQELLERLPKEAVVIYQAGKETQVLRGCSDLD